MKIITNFKNIYEFETARLCARKITENDFDLILPMYQNHDVMKTLGGVVDETEARNRFNKCLSGWEKNGFDAWVWFERDTNKFVGRAGLRALEVDGENVVEIGYVLVPECWNKGYATEIAMAATEIALEVMRLQELVCLTQVTNKASQRVMEKVGFKYSKTFIYYNEPHLFYRLKFSLQS